MTFASLVAHAEVPVQVQPTGLTYTGILVNGSATSKFDIVFIGDGFQKSEQTAFNNKVNEAVAALQNRPGYSARMCGFNIWRVNVLSTDSGIDHPKNGISKNTALDCRYGNPAMSEAERCIVTDSPAKCFEAAANAPARDAVFVLVNDTQWGGCAGNVVCSSIAAGFDGLITHELAHDVGELADEYDCYVCDGSDNNRTYSGSDPSEVNITNNTDRATTKWHDLIQCDDRDSNYLRHAARRRGTLGRRRLLPARSLSSAKFLPHAADCRPLLRRLRSQTGRRSGDPLPGCFRRAQISSLYLAGAFPHPHPDLPELSATARRQSTRPRHAPAGRSAA